MDPMALPWTARWRDFLAWLAIVVLLLAFGIAVYEFTAPAGAPITPVAARIAGFGVNANSSKRMLVGDPTLTVVFRLDDGRRLSRSVNADQASRCRVGEAVKIGLVTARSGVKRVVIPSDLCGH